MSQKTEEPKKNYKGISGLGIPAGALIGMGVGMLVGNLTAWLMIGLGTGFIVMIILRLITKEW